MLESKPNAEAILNRRWLRTVEGFPTRGVVVAVSGGMDSMALLHALWDWCGVEAAQCLHVAHLNHGLRGAAADADAHLVAETAARLGLRWTVETVDVAQAATAEQGNLEAVARRIRYAFLQRTAEQVGAAFIATAHTQSDQAETVLLRLVRGASPDGLTAIAPLRPVADDSPIQVIRPLLATPRPRIAEYVQQCGIQFREDETNRDLTRARNRLRYLVIPELERLNPQLGTALARLAQLAREDSDYLRTVVAEWLHRHARQVGRRWALPVAELTALPPAIRRRVLHTVAQEQAYPAVAFHHIEAIEATLLPDDGVGKCLDLTGGRRVRRVADALVFT
ncbi:MAG: tRNA lysidine(34) synthetase TilS [Chloracidobacterium sp.]|nr:tRNA lysidine(34) synthetase TilS [Chloracidobacterium sp.]MDW8217458.1 tRNA lysidine(34) synthetase TilS [Acidobacteriota bacterium]